MLIKKYEITREGEMNVSSHECWSEIKSQSLRATLAGRNESVVYVYCQFLWDIDHIDAIL
jgi:hypothetical protein